MSRVVCLLLALFSCLLPGLSEANCGGQDNCTTPWKDCGSTGMKVVDVCMSGCCQSSCKLPMHSNISIWTIFIPNQVIPNLSLTQCANIAQGMCVPLAINGSHDVCSELQCPLQAGTTYNFTLLQQTADVYPPMHFPLKMQFNTDKKMVGCVQIPMDV